MSAELTGTGTGTGAVGAVGAAIGEGTVISIAEIDRLVNTCKEIVTDRILPLLADIFRCVDPVDRLVPDRFTRENVCSFYKQLSHIVAAAFFLRHAEAQVPVDDAVATESVATESAATESAEFVISQQEVEMLIGVCKTIIKNRVLPKMKKMFPLINLAEHLIPLRFSSTDICDLFNEVNDRAADEFFLVGQKALKKVEAQTSKASVEAASTVVTKNPAKPGFNMPLFGRR